MSKFEPFVVGWDITNACNYFCKHCNRASGKSKPTELTTKEAVNIIEQLNFDFPKLDHFSFAGGEPFLRKDFLDLVKYSSFKLDMKARINSNGSLITREIAKKLKKWNVYHVQISLDGSNPKVHDSIRGTGTFERSIRGIKNLVKEGISTSIRTTINRFNKDDVINIFKLAEKLKVDRFSIGRTINYGRARLNQTNLNVSPREYLEIISQCFKQAENSNIDFYCTDPLKILAYPKLLEKVEKKSKSKNILSGCIAGIAQFFITCEGKVTGCGVLETITGDVRTQTLREIWDNSPHFKEIRERRIKKNLNPKCNNCEFILLCGGCRASAETVGDFFGEDPFCIKEIKI